MKKQAGQNINAFNESVDAQNKTVGFLAMALKMGRILTPWSFQLDGCYRKEGRIDEPRRHIKVTVIALLEKHVQLHDDRQVISYII